MTTRYEHTQSDPLWLMLAAMITALFVAAGRSEGEALRVLFLCLGVLFALVAAMFSHLSVRETDDQLVVRFGPLRWAGTNVRYDALRGMRRARSRVLDGWGIHWRPGRGWTYSLWGRDCVELSTARGIVRIGTDDADGLLQHLQRRTGLPAG